MTDKERRVAYKRLAAVIEDMDNCIVRLQRDLPKVDTNKAAAARARKTTSELAALGKEFRLQSVNVHRR